MDPGTLLLLSVKVTVPLKFPALGAVKVTTSKHSWFGSRVPGLGQLLLAASMPKPAPVIAMLEMFSGALPTFSKSSSIGVDGTPTEITLKNDSPLQQVPNWPLGAPELPESGTVWVEPAVPL